MPYSTYLPEHMGSVEFVTPGPFVAGSSAELVLVYTAGKFGIDDTGMVKVSWRNTSDLSKPQFEQAGSAELHDGRGEQWRQARGLVRPPQHPPLQQHDPDPRRPGLLAGRRHPDHSARRPSKGIPGLRLQTNVENNVELRVSVDAFATYEFCELPEQPKFDLIPGPAARWKAILPSLAVVGEPFRLAIVAEDMWGNPTADAADTFQLKSSRPRARLA